MHHEYTIYYPIPTDPRDDRRCSIFTRPINIEMGDESSEFLEARIRENTGEAVKVDKDWTRLSGKLSIDNTAVAGFMFQSDASDDGTIELIENECLPIQILIRRNQGFGMYLVTTRRQEQWTTSGNFHLRFVRRCPVLDKPCAIPLEGTSGGSASLLSDPGSSSPGEPEASTNGAESANDQEEEQIAHEKTGGIRIHCDDDQDEQIADDQSEGISFRSHDDKENWADAEDSDDNLTGEEDYRGLGAAALEDPPGMFLPYW